MSLLRKRLTTLIAAFTAVVLLGIIVSALTTPQYSAQATLYVSAQSQTDNSTQAYQGGLLSEQRVQSYVQLITSDRVLSDSLQRAGVPESASDLRQRLAATAPSGTVLLTVRVEDPDGSRAALLANSIGSSFSALVAELERGTGGPNAAPTVAVRQVAAASISPAPVSPNWVSNISLAIGLGVLVALAAVYLREATDTRIRDADQLASAAESAVLGVLPSEKLDRGSEDLRSLDEASAKVRTALQFANVDSPIRSMLFTSSVASEGKTTTVCQVGKAYARAGLRVLLIDGDLRKPRLAEAFGLPAEVGLTTVVVGRTGIEDAVQATRYSNLMVLASGAIPPNPSELLGSSQVAEVISKAQKIYDIVLIDGAPVLPVTDSVVLSARVDGVVLVARAGAARRTVVKAAVESLQAVSAHVLGCLLVGVSSRSGGYGYGYGYGDDLVQRNAPRDAAGPPPQMIQESDSTETIGGLGRSLRPSPHRKH